jgi:acid phosphatase
MGSNNDNMPNNTHGAAGQGPFGQLTMLGLLQMIKLGERLRGELVGLDADEEYNHIFSKPEELHNPHYIKVMSTDFPRTIQSVQAMLTGLLLDNNNHRNKEDYQQNMMIEIDVRDTNAYFIPDPQPRQHRLQLELEKELANRTHLREREIGLQDLARRVTDELDGYLGVGADGISFGIGEEKDISASAAASIGVGKQQQQRRPLLAWAQMCEILVCLHSRNLLPSTITKDDVTTVSNHVAWRWFENLGHPILAKAAMTKFTNVLIDTMRRRVNEDKVVVGGTTNSVVAAASLPDHIHEHVVPRLCIYSAHDSTLIGLLCVLQLERPMVWPEYGSALKVELLREDKETTAVAKNNGGGDDDIKYWVRFSLNGEVLRCNTGLTENEDDDNDNESEASMVSFDRLVEMINSDYDDKELKYIWTNGFLSQN